MAAAHPPVLCNNDLSFDFESIAWTAAATATPCTAAKAPRHLNATNESLSINNNVYSRPSNPSSSSTILTSSSGSTQSLGQQLQKPQPHRRRLYGQHQPPAPAAASSRSGSTFATTAPSRTSLSTSTRRWPMPTTAKEVQTLCKQVRDRQQQLELCLDMMQWIQKTKNDLGSTSSLHLDKTMLRDALETHTRKLLRKLSKTGHNMGEPGISDAQFLLASCHGSGALGLVYDPAKACAWYIQASKQNHREAIYRAGVCHELGLGTRQDFGRAIAYYQRGARLSHSTCMYKLGVILLHGYYKHAPQARLGVSWIQRAADSIVAKSAAPFSSSSLLSSSSSSLLLTATEAQALPYAMHALAMVQLTGECDKTSLIPDTTYALQLLHRAAKMGYEASQCKLAEFYETGTWVEVDDVKSISWYTNAAKQGNPQAALGLSGWYLTGSNTPGVLPQSDRESYLWAKRAANAPIEARDYYAGEKPIELAVANGCYLVGYYSENGIGVARDTSTEEAVLWYRKAACLGHRLAMRRLKALAPTQEDTESSHTSRRRRRKTECLIM